MGAAWRAPKELKKKKLHSFFTSFTKTNSKLITDERIRDKLIKLLARKIEKCLDNLELMRSS